jgi:cyclopropane fatty-acyl-phospholipid synthase-like methyltransferase
MEKSNWERFFDGHAPDYLNNVFTKNTNFEVRFIIDALGLSPGASVLDVGCGTGRHTIPLAKFGVTMTGLDLSAGMLAEARAYAEKEKVRVELIQADATNFQLPQQFDHAISLCEGSFGLLGDDDDPCKRDLAILRNIYNCLKPGAKLLLTVLNGFKKVREHTSEDVKNGVFDPIHLITYEKMNVEESGETTEMSFREKGFTPSELHHLMNRAGFSIMHIWGGTAGAWHKKQLDLDEYEIMVLAEKSLS